MHWNNILPVSSGNKILDPNNRGYQNLISCNVKTQQSSECNKFISSIRRSKSAAKLVDNPTAALKHNNSDAVCFILEQSDAK